jgi:plasmid stabilization system protein ParE
MNANGTQKGMWILGAVALLVIVALLRSESVLPGPRQAQALDNSAETRLKMLAEMRQINQKMDRLIGLFESGKVKVVVSNAEELRAAPAVQAVPAARPDDGDNDKKIIIRRKGD